MSRCAGVSAVTTGVDGTARLVVPWHSSQTPEVVDTVWCRGQVVPGAMKIGHKISTSNIQLSCTHKTSMHLTHKIHAFMHKHTQSEILVAKIREIGKIVV